MREHPPRNPSPDEGEDALEDLAEVDRGRPPAGLGLGEQGWDQLPVIVPEVRRVFRASHDLFYAQNRA